MAGGNAPAFSPRVQRVTCAPASARRVLRYRGPVGDMTQNCEMTGNWLVVQSGKWEKSRLAHPFGDWSHSDPGCENDTTKSLKRHGDLIRSPRRPWPTGCSGFQVRAP